MKPRILLIEDDQPTIEMYREAFKLLAGWKIEVINWGEKTLNYLPTGFRKIKYSIQNSG